MVPFQSPCKTENNDTSSVVTDGTKNALSTRVSTCDGDVQTLCVKGQGDDRQRDVARAHTHIMGWGEEQYRYYEYRLDMHTPVDL